MANLNIAIQIAANDQASGPIGRIKNALGGLSDTAKTGWSGLQNVATMAGGALVGGIGLATTAVAGLGVAALGAFVPFERQMNEVFTLLPGISQDAMSQMTGHVLEFSREFGRLPNEVVPALYQSISAGVPADNVFSFLETAQKAAVGGVTELETAVDGISSVVNAYGQDVMDATKASDLMFTAVKLGKTDFSQLSQSLFNVIPTASALGVEFGDVTAALAAMTAQGTPTSVATTQMRQLLVELSKAGGKTAEIFEKTAGVSFREFVAQGGNVQDALAIMEQAARASGVGINDLFGSVEAGNAALALTGKGAETFAKNLEEMANSAGATDAAFETMDQGLGRSIERLKAFGATALLQIGETLGPLADKVLDLAEGALPTLQNILETAVIPTIETVTGVISSFVANLQEGMSPLDAFIEAIWDLAPPGVLDFLVSLRDEVLPGLSAWFKENVQPVIDMVTGFVSWKDVLIGLGIVVASIVLPALWGIMTAAAPVIAVGAALVGAIALARNAWENDWGGIRTAVEGAWSALQPRFAEVKSVLGDFRDAVLPPLQLAWQTLSNVWRTEIGPALGELWASLQELWATLGFGTGETDLWGIALGMLKFGLNNVVIGVKLLTPFIQGLGDGISMGINLVRTFVDALASMKRGADALIEPLRRVADRIRDLISSALSMPSWLIPGSPTPFELGLRGIGAAIKSMPDMEFDTSAIFPPGGGFPPAAGAMAGGLTAPKTTVTFETGSIVINAPGGEPKLVKQASEDGLMAAFRAVGLR